METLYDQLALRRMTAISTRLWPDILNYFGDIASFLKAEKSELMHLGFSPKSIIQIQSPDWLGVENDLRWKDKKKGRFILTLDHLDYPNFLRHIHDPPPILFVEGNKSKLLARQLAMVGSRKACPIGLDIAYHWAKFFASLGIVITSGLAKGIDTASHRGALSAKKASTIAVLGSGLDKCYPKENQGLMHLIWQQGGACISEFPLGFPPLPHHFPKRNRIISGLSHDGVLIVQASQKSGSLITAKFALDQGKEVFAIPGPPSQLLAMGCHQLIQQGAYLVTSPQDLLLYLPNYDIYNLKNASDQPRLAYKKEINLSDKKENLPNAKNLLSCIGFDATPLALIARRSGLHQEVLIKALTRMVIKGYVQETANGYRRCLNFCL